MLCALIDWMDVVDSLVPQKEFDSVVIFIVCTQNGNLSLANKKNYCQQSASVNVRLHQTSFNQVSKDMTSRAIKHEPVLNIRRPSKPPLPLQVHSHHTPPSFSRLPTFPAEFQLTLVSVLTDGVTGRQGRPGTDRPLDSSSSLG